jgi:hypothetical protein
MDPKGIISIFVAVAAFAYFFTDEFYAVADFLDSTRCSIGIEHYCK